MREGVSGGGGRREGEGEILLSMWPEESLLNKVCLPSLTIEDFNSQIETSHIVSGKAVSSALIPSHVSHLRAADL